MFTTLTEIVDPLLGAAYPKSTIAGFLASTSNRSKSSWENISDAIFWTYYDAVETRRYNAYHPNNPTNNRLLIDYVTSKTGLPKNDIFLYLNGLYTMATMGKIETQYYNPAGAGDAEKTGETKSAGQIAKIVSSVTNPIAAPAKSIFTTLLVAGGIYLVAMTASKQYIKAKTIPRKRSARS